MKFEVNISREILEQAAEDMGVEFDEAVEVLQEYFETFNDTDLVRELLDF